MAPRCFFKTPYCNREILSQRDAPGAHCRFPYCAAPAPRALAVSQRVTCCGGTSGGASGTRVNFSQIHHLCMWGASGTSQLSFLSAYIGEDAPHSDGVAGAATTREPGRPGRWYH
eukprot:gene13585-biopygen5036